MKYIRRPYIVEAFQITEESRYDQDNWPEWFMKAWKDNTIQAVSHSDGMKIITRTGMMEQVHFGDYVICPTDSKHIHRYKQEPFESIFEEFTT